MHLDLAVWLNLISTTAIVAALIFTALQVRQGNIKRKDQGSTRASRVGCRALATILFNV
jgi:hypothetical protein